MTGIALRAATGTDEAFLAAVYASTREAELAVTDWTEEMKATFCRSQFDAQTQHYQTHYPTAEYFVIERAGDRVGRLYVNRNSSEIRIMDLALLPEWRGQGVGTKLLLDLQREAAEADKLLSIHVEKFNPALTLYERLGFRTEIDRGVYLLLHWQAPN